MPIGTSREGDIRRAGLLVTAASMAVVVATWCVIGVVEPGPSRTAVLIGLVVVGFALAGWRALRARRDPTPTAGLRSLASWAAAFSWAATLFSVLVALASPRSGASAVGAGILAGCVLVLAGRASEHRTSRER